MVKPTRPPEEYLGDWKGAVTNLSVYPTGEVDYQRETENSTSSFRGPMIWTEDEAHGRICCMSYRLVIDEKPKDDPNSNRRVMVVNKEKLTSPKR